ncbi:PEPxxWA-CTERM sorting domain-containing protein [Sphingomonas quercus]|uniref:PEPxxWA-CTERM sorting domain-containing protein n=1 Tax=Sphingomonas quercus TaxID=2842451 RepID=UPI00209AD991|nr:PEPxxWA-CTERM sorting domain-containing protein [Sphingomonas quercus]
MRNLKKFGLASLIAIAAALPGAANATAVLFSFDAAASSIKVTENSRQCLPFSGCKLSASLTTPFSDFSIEEGTSQSFNFANFNVSRGLGGDSDARVEAILAFNSPLIGNASTGGTATYGVFGRLVGGSLIWDNPVQQFSGDNGELFTVTFSNLIGVTFGGNALATVTIHLDNVPDAPAAAVPEPATWAMMLAGFGLVGAGLRRRTAVRAVLA